MKINAAKNLHQPYNGKSCEPQRVERCSFAGTDDQIPALIESEVSPKESRKNWARLIQKHAYPVDSGLHSSGFKCINSLLYNVLSPAQSLTLIVKPGDELI